MAFGDGCPGLDLVRDRTPARRPCARAPRRPTRRSRRGRWSRRGSAATAGRRCRGRPHHGSPARARVRLEEVREPAVGRRGLERPSPRCRFEGLGELGVAGLRRPARSCRRSRRDARACAPARRPRAPGARPGRLRRRHPREGSRCTRRSPRAPPSRRVAMRSHSTVSSVGMRSNTSRISCAGLAMTLRSRRCRRASCCSIELEFAAEVGLRDAVDVVDGRGGAQRRERLARRRRSHVRGRPASSRRSGRLGWCGRCRCRWSGSARRGCRPTPRRSDRRRSGCASRCHAFEPRAGHRHHSGGPPVRRPRASRSVRGVVPVRAATDLHVEGHEQVGGVRHAVAHDLPRAARTRPVRPRRSARRAR